MLDVDGNKLFNGTRVAAADNVNGIKLRIGKVIGFTDARVRIEWGIDKPSCKAPHTLVKLFNQDK